MRLLLDECVPRRLKDALPGHEISTPSEMCWSGMRNGELLVLMRESGFEGFVTVDQNVEFQQNVKASGIAVIVLRAHTNRLKDLRPLVPALLRTLSTIKPGALERVGG